MLSLLLDCDNTEYGYIYGKLDDNSKHTSEVNSEKECVEICKNDQLCFYFTWSHNGKSCYLFGSKNKQVAPSDDRYYSGEDWCKCM